jgi:hypothetical protein
LAEYTHNELQECSGVSDSPITVRSILESLGKSEHEIKASLSIFPYCVSHNELLERLHESNMWRSHQLRPKDNDQGYDDEKSTIEIWPWTKVQHENRTFVLRGITPIKMTHDKNGWEFGLVEGDGFPWGYGNTQSEAVESFCFDFALCWDEYACADDSKLTLEAQKIKHGMRLLVETVKMTA